MFATFNVENGVRQVNSVSTFACVYVQAKDAINSRTLSLTALSSVMFYSVIESLFVSLM